MIFIPILKFWLILQIFNLIGLPIAFRLFANLPDRGYAFARPLGLLLCGYGLWLAGSLGFLGNNLGGTLLAMILVGGLGLLWQQQEREYNLPAWLKANRSYVLTVEALFAIAFVGWAIFKAYNPNIETAGGEKWMEIAFINSSLISPFFPPQDPWLSGFGISYYYFGYLLMAMLTRLSGVVSTTAFNLFIPTLFALTLTGAFGLIANMAAAHQINDGRKVFVTSGSVRVAALLGPLFVAVMGHWEGVLEVLHSRGLLSARFWRWLDIRDLKIPPSGPGPWIPDRFIWWWRGSRVLTDYNLAGQEQEVIDEFPFFSFMLGDVHPHVLALPFVLLIIGLALNVLLNRDMIKPKSLPPTPNFLLPLQRGLTDLVAATGGRIHFLLCAVALGALGFLNTWDFPIYLALFGLAYLAWRGWARMGEAIWGLFVFAVLGGVLYLPFYLSFQSQAGGVLPNLWNPTRLPQFVVFFGPFLVVVIVYLTIFSRWGTWPWRQYLGRSFSLTVLGPVLLLLLLTLSFLILPPGREFIQRLLNDPAVQAALEGASQSNLVSEIINRRVGNPWTFLLLGILAGWSLAYLWASMADDQALNVETWAGVEKFNLILLLMGVALPLSVEFVFLRDLFNTRMNTVFKFYFQAWILLALASAFGVYYINRKLDGAGRVIWQGIVILMVLAGMVYPALAIPNKAGYFQRQPTLDGITWVADQHFDDYAAIMWLRENAPPEAIVLERPGQSYRYLSRVSALTGRATLLGWDFHEAQWRGNYEESGRRRPDIDILYNGIDPARTLTLLDKYDINYVYVGPLERQEYSPSGLAKFEQLLDVAFIQGDVVIYQR